MAEHFCNATILPLVSELACATPGAALYRANISQNSACCLCRARSLQLRASLHGNSGKQVKYKQKCRDLFWLKPFPMLICLTAFCWHTFLFPLCYTSPSFRSRTAGHLIINEWNRMDWLIPASSSIKASVAALPLMVLCWCVSPSLSLELSWRVVWRLCSQCLHPFIENPASPHPESVRFEHSCSKWALVRETYPGISVNYLSTKLLSQNS